GWEGSLSLDSVPCAPHVGQGSSGPDPDYFIRSGNEGFPYRTAFLTLDCGTAKLVPLTVGIEMAGGETGAGPGAGTLRCHLPKVGLGSGIARERSPMGKFGLRAKLTSNRSYGRRRLRLAKRTTRCPPWRRGVGAPYTSGRGSCARARRMSGERGTR